MASFKNRLVKVNFSFKYLHCQPILNKFYKKYIKGLYSIYPNSLNTLHGTNPFTLSICFRFFMCDSHDQEPSTLKIIVSMCLFNLYNFSFYLCLYVLLLLCIKELCYVCILYFYISVHEEQIQ